MLSPFDLWMWLGTIFSCLSFVVVCVFILRYKMKRELVLWTVSALLQQTDESATMELFKNIRWKYVGLILTWLFASFLLSSFYQGALFSSLTTSVPPKVPASLTEALAMKFPLMTTGCYIQFLSKEPGKCKSYLHSIIIPDLLYKRETEDAFFSFVKDVNDTVSFLDGRHLALVRNMSEELQVRILINGLETDTKMPDTFGLFSSSADSEEFSQAMKWYFPEKMQVKVQDLNPFIFRSPWVGSLNAFYIMFSRGLVNLIEGGIYHRWEKHHSLSLQLSQITEFLENSTLPVTAAAATASIVPSSFGNIYMRFVIADKTRVITFNEANPVSLSVMKVPFVICLILAGLGALILASELMKSNVVRIAILNPI
jgi:hypothetical protein